MFRFGSELPPLEGQDNFFLIGWQGTCETVFRNGPTIFDFTVFLTISASLPRTLDQCDSVGIATWEKNGIAQNLRTVCRSDEQDPEELEASSSAFPISKFGVQFDEVFVPNGLAEAITMSTTVKCVSVSCPAITLMEETFQDGQRTVFEMGELVEVSEEVFQKEVNAAPSLYHAGDTNAAFVPTENGCATDRCYTDKQICAAGDPSIFCSENYPGDFTPSPYQNDDGDVKPGVVAALTIFSILFVMFLIFVAYLFAKRAQNARARYFFAHRMIEVMQVDKSMDEFTARDIMTEYKALQERLKGEIDEDKMYEFLSTGKLGYMDWGEFGQLWAHLDQAGCGKVSFLGFCAYMGHSWREFDELRAEKGQAEGPTAD